MLQLFMTTKKMPIWFTVSEPILQLVSLIVLQYLLHMLTGCLLSAGSEFPSVAFFLYCLFQQCFNFSPYKLTVLNPFRVIMNYLYTCISLERKLIGELFLSNIYSHLGNMISLLIQFKKIQVFPKLLDYK